MKQEIKVNDKVQLHPTGTIFIVKGIANRLAVIETEDGQKCPATPVSMLDKVEE